MTIVILILFQMAAGHFVAVIVPEWLGLPSFAIVLLINLVVFTAFALLQKEKVAQHLLVVLLLLWLFTALVSYVFWGVNTLEERNLLLFLPDVFAALMALGISKLAPRFYQHAT
ncbi:hypothetical protein ISG33_13690 [Glaciecola sp. MH2013]|uniref:hypothetical protein n=1 Tax=Glaciecola sp. MH2013 TaxID=2785524 RepID=UPI00189ED736|nr:hypothetical protein [Glaciecola sp. MH2013]MBF7074453.1 hypothetical protein [Glaciecola sp. MH2013]